MIASLKGLDVPIAMPKKMNPFQWTILEKISFNYTKGPKKGNPFSEINVKIYPSFLFKKKKKSALNSVYQDLSYELSNNEKNSNKKWTKKEISRKKILLFKNYLYSKT